MTTSEDIVVLLDEGFEVFSSGSETELQCRTIYLARQVMKDIDAFVLSDPGMEKGGLTMSGHLQELLYEFTYDERFRFAGRAKRTDPTANGIWEFKPWGVRIFGWFLHPDFFVAGEFKTKTETKGNRALVQSCRENVQQMRSNLFPRRDNYVAGDIRYVISYKD